MFPPHIREDRVQFHIRLLQGCAFAQAPHHAQMLAATARRRLLTLVPQRPPNLRRQFFVRKNGLERRGHHSHNPPFVSVERNGLPNHRRISAEAPLPQSMADNHHVILIRPILLRIERAAQQRCNTQHLEKIFAHE